MPFGSRPIRQREANEGLAGESFGDVLRRYRAAAGLSQQALAERAGLSAKAISSLECGTRRAPYRATLESLARALNLSPEENAGFSAAWTGNRRRAHSVALTNRRCTTGGMLYVTITIEPSAAEGALDVQLFATTSPERNVRRRIDTSFGDAFYFEEIENAS